MELLTIENRAGKVRLDGTVTHESMDELIDRLATLYGDEAVRNELVIGEAVASAEEALEEIEIEINSPGGSVRQGYRAFKTIKALRDRGVKVTARVTELAASMGSVLAAAADVVLIEKDARMMIHDVSTMDWGNADQLRKTAAQLDAISDELAAIYSARNGKPVAEMREHMKRETWLDAGESIEMGLADEVYQAEEKEKTRLDRLLDGEEASIDTPSTGVKLLSKLFPDNEAAARLDTELAENETLRADLAEAQAKLTELSGQAEEITGLRTKLGEVEASLTEAQGTIEKQTAELEQLAEDATATKEKTSLEASRLLAASGHPQPAEVPTETEPKSIREQYAAMAPGPERKAFREAHINEL
jgi:ATP-dependent Clp protease, protease subunit